MKKLLLIVSLALWSIMLHGGGVTFIITADLHGSLDEFAKLAPEIRRYPEAVKIDLGDIVQGNFAAVYGEGFPVIECFNTLDYEIFVPGNHDLEFPETTLKQWQKFFRGKMLGSQWELGNFRMPGSAVVERDGYRIGIVAIGAVGLKRYAGFWQKLKYHDIAVAVRNEINGLKRQSCDAFLLVGHVGAENFGVLFELIRDNPEINAVIGSHSHREVPCGRIGKVIAVQPAPHGGSAVKLELIFGKERRLQYIRSTMLYPQQFADKEIMAIAGRMEQNSAIARDRLLGKFRDAAGFGRCAAEIIRQLSGADAAIIGVDTAAFRNDVTGQVLFEMMPYGNRISLITLPRQTVLKLLRKKRKSRRYFGAGDFSGAYIKVAVSDFMLSEISDPPPAEVWERFERLEIEKALKSGNIPDFDPE